MKQIRVVRSNPELYAKIQSAVTVALLMQHEILIRAPRKAGGASSCSPVSFSNGHHQQLCPAALLNRKGRDQKSQPFEYPTEPFPRPLLTQP